MGEEKVTVVIRRQWNDWRQAEVHLEDLRHIHWDPISGGFVATAPQPFIHARVSCTDVEGDIAHSCLHGPPPHEIKVCVVKKDNSPEIYRSLLELAGPKPPRQPSRKRLLREKNRRVDQDAPGE